MQYTTRSYFKLYTGIGKYNALSYWEWKTSTHISKDVDIVIGEYIPCTMKYIKPYLSNLAKSMQIHLLLVLVENVMNGNISISRTAKWFDKNGDKMQLRIQ